MTPEARAREQIDNRLRQSGWTIQDLKQLNLTVASGVAVREFPTNTGPVDYALFIEGAPVGVVEAKKDEEGQALTDVETQSSRYANSQFKWVKREYKVRFAYEATGELVRFTDYADLKYRSRKVFSFHRPETLKRWLAEPDTVRNNLKRIPQLEESGFRKCQISAIHGLDTSFSENRPRALVQMATGAGKTFTAITAAYRLLKYGRMNRILFLVDTRSLGEQAEREFMAYKPNDDPRSFSELYGVRRLKNSYISGDVQVCISTIQRMYSILKGEELDEQAEEIPFAEYVTAESKAPKEVVYNAKIPPEFFDCIIVDECHRSIYNVWSQVLSYFDAFTDTTYKTFQCNEHIGISTCGDASINQTPIAGYIEKFIHERVNADSSVGQVSNDLLNYEGLQILEPCDRNDEKLMEENAQKQSQLFH